MGGALMKTTKSGLELFKPGEKVLYSGEYVLVNEQGQRQENISEVTLDEGERFPDVSEKGLFYMLNDTCLDEACEVIGGPTEEVE
jgi:hypothetical protein